MPPASASSACPMRPSSITIGSPTSDGAERVDVPGDGVARAAPRRGRAGCRRGTGAAAASAASFSSAMAVSVPLMIDSFGSVGQATGPIPGGRAVAPRTRDRAAPEGRRRAARSADRGSLHSRHDVSLLLPGIRSERAAGPHQQGFGGVHRAADQLGALGHRAVVQVAQRQHRRGGVRAAGPARSRRRCGRVRRPSRRRGRPAPAVRPPAR